MSIDDNVINSDFLKSIAPTPLRVCCYGSSSARTPELYLKEARTLGYTLARRGHTCVNGAGSFGCMAALNEGAAHGDGHIVGVIHEMFLIDASESKVTRDGGAHPVFDLSNPNGKSDGLNNPRREILVAGGNDLQERKRLLVDRADALIVLPGGPGTWDELWEMACARQIGLSKLPIVCVNVDGFYEPFRTMLERAAKDCLLHMEASKIVHFEASVESAVRWIEEGKFNSTVNVSVRKRSSALRRSSFLHAPILGKSASSIQYVISRSLSYVSEAADAGYQSVGPSISCAIFFFAGACAGVLFAQNGQINTR